MVATLSSETLSRRRLLGGASAALAIAGLPLPLRAMGTAAAIGPMRLDPARIVRVTVCLRPFRAAGPRIEAERIAGRRVVHHYGHGGSGWSLGWGSAREAVPLALAGGPREIAVVGAGAIGLTTAITAQRLGAKVTVYARERFPEVRSARATGTWSPHSRIAFEQAVDGDFARRWEAMARTTFALHQGYVGLADHPVEWTDRYTLSDTPITRRPHTPVPLAGGGSGLFVDYEEAVKAVRPGRETLMAGQHPFAVPHVRRSSTLTFNVPALARALEAEFLASGGRFVPMTLAGPADFGRIPERAIINCTGYGARDLLGDESVIPVRGQIAWLPPQDGPTVGLQYRDVSVLARRDGTVVQYQGSDEAYGFADANEIPDHQTARESLERLSGLFA
ncbi:MAG TPA: FAD-dependent oxidoreductase [Novosphingobium sp.]|nr:FAD-dependent oxidoreductase [Novosphingobium sp.]